MSSTFHETGSPTINRVGVLLVLVLVIGIFSYFAAQSIVALFGLLAIAGVIVFIVKLYKKPSLGMDFILISSFVIAGFTRIKALPFGLSTDIMMLLLWLILFIKGFYKGDFSAKNNVLSLGMLLWALYCIAELFNPLASSAMAWFYAVRGLAFNAAIMIPLVFLLKNKPSDFRQFINIWFAFSILLGLYGAKQYWLGVFGFEQSWLDNGGHVTHVLWGRFTRMFSFLSDANQFGCSQGHAGIAALIMIKAGRNWWEKLFYSVTAVVSFYGMFISGTRGAIVIPIISFGAYLVLSKNFKTMIAGGLLGGVAMYLLVFTYVGHGIEPVRRMRTAFQATEDASFQVRIENRKILDAYMSDKPFGGGIGSAGVWGQRFSPDHFLAHFETDGHYVRIHAETGKVGLYLYLIIHVLILMKMLWICWNLKNEYLKTAMSAITVGIIGLMAANYSAAVTIGLPTSTLVYWSMAFVFMAPKWDQNQQFPAIIKEEKLK